MKPNTRIQLLAASLTLIAGIAAELGLEYIAAALVIISFVFFLSCVE